MNKFIMTVGLPSAGKSKGSNVLSEYEGFETHSSDNLRKELYGDVNYQDKNEELFKELHKRIKKDLSEGKNVIYDACNISYKRRMEFLRQINYIKCGKECWLFATPYNDCVLEDNKRERSVGQEVITKMYKNFYVPQYYEGWDNIKIVWNFKNTNFDIVAYLAELDEINQETPYHTLTIGEHMDSTYDKLKNLTDNHKLMVVAQIHDIGKLFCKEYNEKKGYCTYYQHHLVGAYDALFYLKKNKWNDNEILEMCNYIQWHMKPFETENNIKSKDKFIKLVGKEFYDNLLLLHSADKLAK